MTLQFVPWGEEPLFDWDEFNLREIANHQVRDFEVEDCFENERHVRHHPKWKSEPGKYGNRYVIHGESNGGKKLFVIVDYLGGNLLRPVTAWERKK